MPPNLAQRGRHAKDQRYSNSLPRRSEGRNRAVSFVTAPTCCVKSNFWPARPTWPNFSPSASPPRKFGANSPMAATTTRWPSLSTSNILKTFSAATCCASRVWRNPFTPKSEYGFRFNSDLSVQNTPQGPNQFSHERNTGTDAGVCFLSSHAGLQRGGCGRTHWWLNHSACGL